MFLVLVSVDHIQSAKQLQNADYKNILLRNSYHLGTNFVIVYIIYAVNIHLGYKKTSL